MAKPRRGSDMVSNNIVNTISYYEKENKLVYYVVEILFYDGTIVKMKDLRAFVGEEREDDFN